MQTELELLLKGLPGKRRAILCKRLKVNPRTLDRWMKAPRRYIGLESAPIIKEELDRHYEADHDLQALSKPVRIHGQKRVAA